MVIAKLVQETFGLMIEFQSRQDLLMPDTPARVGIHDVYQFFNRVFAIANHVTGHSFRRSNKLAIHDEEPVVVSLQVTLDDDAATMFAGLVKRNFNLFRRLQVDGHTSPMVAGKGFERDGLDL